MRLTKKMFKQRIFLGTVGPISVSISGKDIKSYGGGIFDNSSCSQKLSHGLLAIGYGTENNLDYWILKNSWGTKWGEDGYIYIARNKNQQCGISTRNSYPIIA